jgi:cyclic-di-GMP phosphodiesterase TipF (flagellum assembly factor)
MRIAAIFVAVCMVLIAGSAGAVVYLYFGLSLLEAIAVAIAILAALALYNTISTRLGLRRAVGHQLSDLSRGGADVARQVAEMGRRLAEMEQHVGVAVDKTHAATDPLSAEIGELGTLVNQLAETVAAHEVRLAELARRPALPAVSLAETSSPRPEMAPPAPAPSMPPPAPALEPAAVAPDTAASQTEALADIRGAIEANRVDLFLQPIVTLPQRKVRYYEAMSRLRNERGDVLHAADFVPQAESGGLMPQIDNLVAFRCVQVVRRLLLKNRDIGLFCNVSGSTLTDSTVFPQFLEFMDANRAIAPSLVLEFTQAAVRGMGPIEHESLAALAERGFRFSLDNVADLRIEPRELADRSFRFIKIPASLLLNRAGTATTDIHPADLSDLLGRFGIDLIADKIEGEGSVVDLLDYDVRYGQGFLFSAPRPVRAEALQGIAERSDVVARDVAPVPERPALRPSEPGTPSPETGNKGERTTGLAQLARGIVSRG